LMRTYISSAFLAAAVPPAIQGRSFAKVPWSWEPAIVLPLVILVAVYTAGSFRRGSIHTLRWRHVSFYVGWLTLALALMSPIHELGEQLFSAHMLQHEILILVSAPLISASHPGATLLWAFAPCHRANLGGWVRTIEHAAPIALLTRPLSAWLLEAAALWIWHIPALYQATLTSNWIHAAQHLSFFVTAVLFWSALYGVGRSAMSYGAATFYVFGTAAHCSALGALLTFSTVLWYPAYRLTTQPWGLSPLQDQQLGGVIMWVPSGLVFVVIGLAVFAKWLRESDNRLLHTSLQTALDAAKGDPS
ncbi:MAG TPA: cytochrome c oxidase assembly protein, partial [Acidobacteriaceae bacterium]|nr:cytochrome c oxidase assembly protein [Acidobacteriaceae bacterium]